MNKMTVNNMTVLEMTVDNITVSNTPHVRGGVAFALPAAITLSV